MKTKRFSISEIEVLAPEAMAAGGIDCWDKRDYNTDDETFWNYIIDRKTGICYQAVGIPFDDVADLLGVAVHGAYSY